MIRSPTCSSCLSESRKIFSKKVFVSSGIKSPFVLEIVLQAVFPRDEFAKEEMDAFLQETQDRPPQKTPLLLNVDPEHFHTIMTPSMTYKQVLLSKFIFSLNFKERKKRHFVVGGNGKCCPVLGGRSNLVKK